MRSDHASFRAGSALSGLSLILAACEPRKDADTHRDTSLVFLIVAAARAASATVALFLRR